MAKVGMFFIGVLWLLAWSYAGFVLAGNSFAWIYEVSTTVPSSNNEKTPLFDTAALQDIPNILPTSLPKTVTEAGDWFRSLDAKKQECLIEVIGQERADTAVKSGELKPTAREAIAVALCLK